MVIEERSFYCQNLQSSDNQQPIKDALDDVPGVFVLRLDVDAHKIYMRCNDHQAELNALKRLEDAGYPAIAS